MITITWVGKFVQEGCKPLCVKISFSGSDINDVSGILHEYVETKTDDGWILEEGEITKVTTQ